MAMFGFGDKRAEAVDETERYIKSMFAGLGDAEEQAFPDGALADPYVAGFLQVLTVHSVATVYLTRMPDEPALAEIVASALDRIAPGRGAVLRKGLAEFGDPAHPQHAAYVSGRRDGSEHVRALLASDEIARNQRYHSFRDFVERHYL
jgi:hypothetical protein